jgi:hypothetical protein
VSLVAGIDSASRYEYRVSWQREGQQRKRVLYQTLRGAEHCAEQQRTASEDMYWLNVPYKDEDCRPPEIVDGPFIECRVVGEWDAA